MRPCPFCGTELAEKESSPIELLGGEKLDAHIYLCENPKCARAVRAQLPDKVRQMAPEGKR